MTIRATCPTPGETAINPELPALSPPSLSRRIYHGVKWRAQHASYATQTYILGALRPLLKPIAAPELVLHIGKHKTGSTSIQASMLRQRRAFLRHGIYPLRSGQGSDGAHHALLYQLDDRPVRPVSGKLVAAEIARAGSRRALISSEVAWEIIAAGSGDRLIDLLRAKGARQVHLIMFIRCPYASANSMYSQKTGSLLLKGKTFEEYLPEYDASALTDHKPLLDLSKRQDVDLTLRPYGSDVVADFARTIGVNLPAGDRRENRSFGPVAVEALRLISTELEFKDAAHWDRVRNHLRRMAAAVDERPFWAIGPEHEARLSTAERRTEEICRAIWGKGWREALGQEQRPRNVYDAADGTQRAGMLRLLEKMRLAAATIA